MHAPRRRRMSSRTPCDSEVQQVLHNGSRCIRIEHVRHSLVVDQPVTRLDGVVHQPAGGAVVGGPPREFVGRPFRIQVMSMM